MEIKPKTGKMSHVKLEILYHMRVTSMYKLLTRVLRVLKMCIGHLTTHRGSQTRGGGLNTVPDLIKRPPASFKQTK